MRNSKKVLTVLMLAALTVSLSACSLSKKSDMTTLAADGEGKFTETIVETIDEETVTQEELTEYISQAVSFYNQGGDSAVSMDSCEIKGDKATIVMSYADFRAYSGFNQVPCFIGTIREAEDAGYSVLSTVLHDSSGKPADMKVISERQKEWKVMILAEPVNVRTPDKILYASDNVTIKGRTTAVVESVMNDEFTPEEAVVSASTDSGKEKVSTESAEGVINPFATVYEKYACIIFK